MAKKITAENITAENIMFTSSLDAKKENGEKTGFIASPYCIGVYLVIDGQQLTMNWKGYEKWVKGSKKKLEGNGFTVTLEQQPLTNFLSKEDIEGYILN